MKIAKSKLKEIILEEISLVVQEQEKLSGSDARKAGFEASKEMTASGIDDNERAIIVDLLKILQRAAAAGNITSGMPATRISQLADILKKLGGDGAAVEAGQTGEEQ